MKVDKKRILLVAAVVLIGAVFILLPSKKKENIVITTSDNGWDSQKFHNAVAKLVVENAFDGYEVQFSTASSNMNWQSMITGDIDLDIESWTDNVATYQQDKAGGNVVEVGVLVSDSAQGLYVPRYVIEGDAEAGIAPMAPDLRHVRDLKKYAHLFPDEERQGKGRLFGAIPGWMADEVLHKKYIHYGLDKEYTYARLGSESSLFAALDAAYNLKQPWVGYCYEPTWIAGKLDLVLLEDEPYEEAAFVQGKTAFPKQELRIVSSSKFAERAPELVPFFQKYRTGSALVSQTLAYLDENKASHDDAAIWFLKSNDYLIDEWLPAENAEKLRKHLSSK